MENIQTDYALQTFRKERAAGFRALPRHDDLRRCLERLGPCHIERRISENLDGFAGAGGNFIDTANKYNEGGSESLLGEFLESDRDHFVVATKYTLFTREGDPNACGNHRKNMARALEASLKRLKTDYIDL